MPLPPGLPATRPPTWTAFCKATFFFRNAPHLHENRRLICGSVCGVKVEAIEDPLLREIRYLDKLVDELAKGKPLDKVLRA